MRQTFLSVTLLTLANLMASHGSFVAAQDISNLEHPSTIQFARDIQPILSEHCYACHGTDPESREAGLRLDDPEAWLSELESGEGQAIVPGEPQQSVALHRVLSTDDDCMPPEHFAKPLNEDQKKLLERWIKQGAKWQQHWAYAPIETKVPSADRLPQSDWVQGWQQPIDRYLAAAIAESGNDQIQPNAKADPVTLVRRVHFDLTGLPPDPQTVSQFVADPSPAAYQQMVDHLLQTDAHAEHLTRYWLDWVRFADTVGYHGDQPHAIWPYRDYVIRAFRDNMPFDQFSREQLAGDLLENPTEDQLIASAYNRMLQTTHEGGAQDLEYREKYLADRVRNFSEVWLAATLACAQCHDHKYDPLTQKDFYSLGAFFADIDERGSYDGVAPNATPTLRHPQKQVTSPLDRERVPDDLEQRVAAMLETQLEAEWKNALDAKRAKVKDPDAREAVQLDDKEREQTKDRLAQRLREQLLEEAGVRSGQCMYTRSITPREIRLLPRGDWLDRSGPVVHPETPAALPARQTPVSTAESQPNRLDLANWLFQENNPLPARVLANRLWYVAFHRGLSSNLGDFGLQGSWPSHPELLDYLAGRLQDSGWNVREVLREIVLSQAYQQSSHPPTQTADPANRYYTRQLRPRLSAEEIRDNALSVSGLLNPTVGGPSAKPYQPKGYYRSLNFPERTYQPSTGQELYRRGVYTHWQRQFLHPMLKAFDAPTREECTAERSISNTPSASLVLLNAPEFVEAARALALRAHRQSKNSADAVTGASETLRSMFRQVLSREPDAVELERLQALYDSQRQRASEEPESEALLQVATPLPLETVQEAGLDLPQLFALTQVARVLLNLDETITRY